MFAGVPERTIGRDDSVSAVGMSLDRVQVETDNVNQSGFWFDLEEFDPGPR
jgi:hypothetical protein